MTSKMSGGKGYDAEEALRSYFLSSGYFAVRSVPFNYRNYDVTDIDIWLYMRATHLNRERACVDIKRRKTPQAMERIFWTKGLREALGIERAIVVTSDNRPETRTFGAANDVTVLHGEFQQYLIDNYDTKERITEEDIFKLLSIPCVINREVVWAKWYRSAKTKLITCCNFNGCNISTLVY